MIFKVLQVSLSSSSSLEVINVYFGKTRECFGQEEYYLEELSLSLFPSLSVFPSPFSLSLLLPFSSLLLTHTLCLSPSPFLFISLSPRLLSLTLPLSLSQTHTIQRTFHLLCSLLVESVWLFPSLPPGLLLLCTPSHSLFSHVEEPSTKS